MVKDLTLVELQKQIEELQVKANVIIQAEKSGVIEELKAKISMYKLTAEELGFNWFVEEIKTTKKNKTAEKEKAPAVYRNPENGETWTGGRGKRPIWVNTIIEKLKKNNNKTDISSEEIKKYLDENNYKIEVREVAEEKK